MSTPGRVAVLLAVLLAAGGCAGDDPVPAVAGAGPDAVEVPTATATPPANTVSPEPIATGETGPRPIPDDDTVPVRLVIEAIGVDSALETLERDGDARLRAPVDWQSAGWFAGGPVPGEPGPAVIAGHVDSPDGPAVFAALDELRRGDRIIVARSDGVEVEFEVDGSRTVAQADFPTATVYGPVPDRQLRLITCDTFDQASDRYVDNLVVFATMVGGPGMLPGQDQ
ncbi:sortase domain-bontaining protein [Jiangella asiatica]|uniref:Class F sortase n=1 Tax=Jiangella asiatica TaxID=2530372 RepID=A0A4R5DA82_9ACTN|nr:sortase [Jiangella asiatica]TDE08870.1 class F sortase [Jiangella asiatica]